MSELASTVLARLATLPERAAEIFLDGKRPLILVPHPDDESLGCGGLIAASCKLGLEPIVIFLTDGAASHLGSPSFPPARLRDVRQAEARQALKLLGVPDANSYFLNYPDGKLPKPEEAGTHLVDKLAIITRRGGCGVILTSWEEDPHCDHKAAARLGAFLAKKCGLDLWYYSVWGWLLPPDAFVQAVPHSNGWRVPIDSNLSLKRQAVAAHRSQLGLLIHDSEQAFVIPKTLLSVMLRRHEVFFQT